MGWIVFVVVLLIVANSVRSRANRTRARQQLPMASQPMQTPQTMLSGPIAPGTAAVYQPGDSPTYRPGDSPTYRPGDSSTYAPAQAIGSRPVVGPPMGQWAPSAQPTPTSRQSPPDSTENSSYQPLYASRAEVATAWRDQAIMDKDLRTASRTAPEQAPYQGSTAIGSTALDTTLATPYQPSSLMTSLTSSLSSSLTDSPPRMAPTTAFAEVAVVSLSPQLVEQVRFHLRNGHEVEAVRLVCDSMNVGLLEATKTVRSYV